MKNFLFGVDNRFRLQFRSEFFNAFNHVTFNVPGFSGAINGGTTVIVGTPAAARVISQWNSPRQLQFALKLYF